MTGLPPKEELALRIDYIQTFGTEQGKSVLKDLGARCFKYSTTYGGTTEQTLINEGLRMALLHIESMMDSEAINKLKGEINEQS